LKTKCVFSSITLLSLAAFQLGAQAPVPNPASISLSAPLMSTASVSQAITLTGPPSEQWRVQANGGFWLLFTTPTCPTALNSCVVTNPISGSTTVTAILDPSTIQTIPYTYNGSITVSYGPNYLSLDAPHITIPISFTIGGSSNALSATPSTLNFTSALNGSAQTQNLSIASTGAANSIYFATTSNATWLTTSLGGSSVFAPANLTVTANPAGLAAGTYQGTLTFTPAGGTAAVITVGVTFVVGGGSAGQQLVVNPTSLAFGGGVSSIPVSINVNSGNQVPFTVGISYPGLAALRWLTPSVTNGQTGTTLTLTATPGSLPAGSYSAYVTISSPGLTSVNINATLNGPVSPGTGTPQFISNINPISIVVQPTVSGSQTFTLSTSNGAAVPYTIATQYSTSTPGTNWLSVTNSSGTTPNQVTVTANGSGFPPGAYSANLIVTSSTSGINALTIPVMMTVGNSSSLPTVLFSPSQFNFTSVVNGSTADQTLTLTSNVAPAVSYSLTANASWLSVLTSTGVTPGTTTVRVNPAGLGAGTYNGSITMTAVGAANNGTTIPVTLTVSGTSQGLALNPISLRFVAQVNGGFPPAQNVQVTGSAGNYVVASSQPWLLVTPSNGTTPSSLTVQANPTGLTAGTYNGNVTVSSSNGASATLAVTLLVTTNASLQLSQQSVTFNYQTNTVPPLPRAVLVTSSNGAAIGYTASVTPGSGGNWLQALPASGTTSSSITLGLINSVVSTLPPGSYSATVTVNAPTAANISSVINVTLNVSTTSLLTMSTAAASFNAQSNGAVPPPQTRQITASSGVLGLSVSSFTSTGSGWLTATLNSNVTPATLTISVSPAGLSTGLFSGSVTVSSGGSGSLTIPVTMNVVSIPVINADKAELVFGGDTSTAAQQSIQLSSTSGNLPYEVITSVMGNPVQWLSVNATSGVTPSTLTVTVNPGQLGGGTYSGIIVIAPQSAGAPPIAIPVTLIVNLTSTLQATPTSLTFTQLVGGALPAQQTVQVTSQTPVPYTFNTTIQTPNGGNWLTVTQSSSQTNGTLQVALNSSAATLPVGNYTALINVLGPNSANIVPIAVNLTVASTNGLVATPLSLSFAARVGQPNPPSQTVQVNSAISGSPISFNVLSDVPWLSVTPTAATSPATLTVSVIPSAVPAGVNSAVGHLTVLPLVGGLPTSITVSITVERNAAPVITAYANSATFQAGSLSPGMLISIVGSNLGPVQAVSGPVVNGRFLTEVARVRVLFDGIAAPILYASSTQINTAVPYLVQGRAFTQMAVEYNGVLSNTLAPRIEDAAPGIFTTDGHQAAALNSDGSVNSAANPALAGSIVVLYVTGEGQTTPAGVDGEVVPANNLKKPLASVRVRVNGVDVPAADVVYAGSAPELVSGLMQINFKLPATAVANNATPVEVLVGAGQSPVGTTIAVRR
jgi:uncharacterized protein (TIGR03437 family)